jgi:hypothetical protein
MAKQPNCVNCLARIVSPPQCKPMAKQDKSRDERLAKALRENLRRRKAQSRKMDKDVTSDDARSPSRQ